MVKILTALCAAAAMTFQTPAGPPPATPPPTGAPPATEVFVASLTATDGKLSVGKPENISNSPGYDNQPFFAPDGRTLFFTSARGSVSSKCGSPQTDIYKFDLQSREVARVTETDDCEYSPTVTPDGKHISVIRVEPDGTQRLWKFTIDGKNPSLVLSEVKPVGYHAWIDDRMLALFVLGQPATLQIADSTTGNADIRARNIGQSIQKMPNGNISFVQQSGEGPERSLTVMELVMKDGKALPQPLTPVVAGATQAHVSWMPDGTLLMAHNGSLHSWKAGTGGWRVVADLAALGLRNVTRLAVSRTGDRIAIVAVETDGEGAGTHAEGARTDGEVRELTLESAELTLEVRELTPRCGNCRRGTRLMVRVRRPMKPSTLSEAPAPSTKRLHPQRSARTLSEAPAPSAKRLHSQRSALD